MRAIQAPCPAAKTKWSKEKYIWKTQVTRAVGRGPSTLANWLCDTYANRNTAVCWPSNALLAQDLNVDIRTIQRWMKALIDGRWVTKVRLPRHRRAFQLTFPTGIEGDSEGDTTSAPNRTDLSAKHDTPVAPYKEPLKNPKERAQKDQGKPLAFIRIPADETTPCSEWRAWTKQHMYLDWEELRASIQSNGWIHLPCRFPKDGEKDREQYVAFFQNAVMSRGKLFDA